MNIPYPFQQFEGIRVLIVASGAQAGRIYIAGDGEIELVDEVKITTTASDADYLQELGRSIKYLDGGIGLDEIYLIGPDYILLEFERSLISKFGRKRIRQLPGDNVVEEHPVRILARLAKVS
ncbi:MAG: hypothetical protein A2114_00455 [Candidatus Vogelbacteria bacterium GWA1_51_14]|uniref:Uncharacterized protein n=1 Tax=Candidatus Vogelbacteria bacterium GWA1_51_14 TaxID=1802435 RepID=A0A1G2Q8V2_9BACT|nr:MAG: hypothetical protein A2114_00455 [Candidatus Vogelbacteria bacterium GWA1_51_14]